MSPLGWLENTDLGSPGHKPGVSRERGGKSGEVKVFTRAMMPETAVYLPASPQGAAPLVISPDFPQH